MAKKKKSAAADAFEWKENNVCVATYNVLEGDAFLDQFEDTEIPFAAAPDVKMKRLRYFPSTTRNPNILAVLGNQMARDFLRQVAKTFTLTKQIPSKTSAATIEELTEIFADGDATILELARVVDENIRFPDES